MKLSKVQKYLKKMISLLKGLMLAMLAYIFYLIVMLLPYPVASKLGNLLGMLIVPKILKGRTKHGIKNIQSTLKLSYNDARKVYIKSCGTLVRVIFELIKAKTVVKSKKYYKIHDPYNIIEKSKTQSFLFFSAHIANWEFGSLGFYNNPEIQKNIWVVFKEPKNPFVRKLLKRLRSYQKKINTIHLDRKGLLKINKLFKTQSPMHLMMLTDQKVTSGIYTLFLGKKAVTTNLLPTLALKYKVPMVPVKIVRKNDIYFDIIYEKPIVIHNSENTSAEDTIKQATQMISDILSEMIKEQPDQWLWMHKRWSINRYAKPPKEDIKEPE